MEEIEEKLIEALVKTGWNEQSATEAVNEILPIYKQALLTKIGEKKRRVRDKHKNDGWADHELPDVNYNQALTDIETLLK